MEFLLFENQLLKGMERLLCWRNYTEMNGHSQEKVIYAIVHGNNVPLKRKNQNFLQ